MDFQRDQELSLARFNCFPKATAKPGLTLGGRAVGVREHTLSGGYNGIEIAVDDTTNAGFFDTGACYDLSKPTKNAMKPAGEWNHIEITSKGPILEVVLNGEKVNRLDLDQWTEKNRRPDGTEHKFDTIWKDHPRTG
jgi:hypothetical protein